MELDTFAPRLFCVTVTCNTSLHLRNKYIKATLKTVTVLHPASCFFKQILKFLFLSFETFFFSSRITCFLIFSLSSSLSFSFITFGGDKDPIWAYWNKWPPALPSTGSTQLNLMLGCPCIFFLSLTNKLIYSNFLMSPFASVNSNINSTLCWATLD